MRATTEYADMTLLADSRDEDRPGVVFLFSGQGGQYPGMAGGLWESWPWFRGRLEELFAVSATNGDQPLAELLLGRGDDPDASHQTRFTQPLLYALELALAEAWQRWGVSPAAVMGHSLGEFAAAGVAGVFSDTDGMRLVTERGRLMQTLPPEGKYIIITGEFTEVAAAARAFRATVAIAGVNAPDLTVVSGRAADVDHVVAACRVRGMSARELPVGLPFHSPLMDPILAPFEDFCGAFRLQPPRIPWVSTVTGRFAEANTATVPAYWRRQIREPVRFWMGMTTLAEAGHHLFLEIGPGSAVLAMGKEAIGAAGRQWLPSLHRGRDDRGSMMVAAMQLRQAGVEVDLQQVRDDCL